MEDVKLPVRLMYMLAGKAKDFNVKDLPSGWTNADTLEWVKDRVAGSLRKTSTYVLNEKILALGVNSYPNYYVAGWFVTSQLPTTELVVIAHGNTMAVAKKLLLDAMPNVPWLQVCADVGV
jgi:hypothetical protein